MKKLYALLLSAAVCLSLAACANTSTKSAPKADVTPLEDAELVELRKFVSGTEQLLEPGAISAETIETSRRIGCFFTSEYHDVRDLDLGKFLDYCAAGEELKAGEDEAEFQAFAAAAGLTADEGWATLNDAPLPVWRYRVADIDALLTQYAGITVAELNNDWKSVLTYLPEYDAFYNMTSDFGAETFSPAKGEKVGDDMVNLYEEKPDAHVLTLQKAGDSWHVVSFTKK